jgi:hypothetical protein
MAIAPAIVRAHKRPLMSDDRGRIEVPANDALDIASRCLTRLPITETLQRALYRQRCRAPMGLMIRRPQHGRHIKRVVRDDVDDQRMHTAGLIIGGQPSSSMGTTRRRNGVLICHPYKTAVGVEHRGCRHGRSRIVYDKHER